MQPDGKMVEMVNYGLGWQPLSGNPPIPTPSSIASTVTAGASTLGATATEAIAKSGNAVGAQIGSHKAMTDTVQAASIKVTQTAAETGEWSWLGIIFLIILVGLLLVSLKQLLIKL